MICKIVESIYIGGQPCQIEWLDKCTMRHTATKDVKGDKVEFYLYGEYFCTWQDLNIKKGETLTVKISGLDECKE